MAIKGNLSPLLGNSSLIVDKRGHRTILQAMPVDPNLLRVARLLVELSVDDLASRANVGRKALATMEAGNSDCMLSTMELVKRALEAEGIVFLGETETHGPGVRVSSATADAWTQKRASRGRNQKTD